MATRTTIVKTISLDKDLISLIEHLAELENRNFSNMVETLLKKQVKNSD